MSQTRRATDDSFCTVNRSSCVRELRRKTKKKTNKKQQENHAARLLSTRFALLLRDGWSTRSRLFIFLTYIESCRYSYGKFLKPELGTNVDLFDALELATRCGMTRPVTKPLSHRHLRYSRTPRWWYQPSRNRGATISSPRALVAIADLCQRMLTRALLMR